MERAFNLVSFGSHYATHIPEFDECKLLINRSILRREILASFDGFHDHATAPPRSQMNSGRSFLSANATPIVIAHHAASSTPPFARSPPSR
jgi:hypothetical protein